jgi:predicted nucleic acid-binding protein
MPQTLIAIDSNILVYAEGVNDLEREVLARACLMDLPSNSVRIPVQALGELYRVLIRKANYSAKQAGESTAQFEQFAPLLPTTVSAFKDALKIVDSHNFQIWDAIIVAVSAESDCGVLLSEDMQDGFVWRGVEIINPLTPDGAARLQRFI